jgi:hypothetical protein
MYLADYRTTDAIGTCSMLSHDKNGVVDSKLKVSALSKALQKGTDLNAGI